MSHAADLDFESWAACVDHLIDQRTADFEARARQITGRLAAELILDAIGGGGDLLKKGHRLLAPTGRLGIFGVSSGPPNTTGGMFGMLSISRARPGLQFNLPSLMNGNKGVFGVNLGIWTSSVCGATLGRMTADSQGSSCDSAPPNNEGANLRSGNGAIYAQGGQQS